MTSAPAPAGMKVRPSAVWLLVGAVGAAGCEALSPPGDVHHPGPLDASFAVSDYFTPSGHMGDGEKPGHLTVDVLDEGCKPRPPSAVGDCYRFVYRPGDKRWAGVYWVYPANNWGSRAGRSIEGRRFNKVRFAAASATPDLLVGFYVGNIADSSLPNRDRVAGSTIVRLDTEWKHIEINVSGEDFDQLLGAFAWSLAYPEDWDGQAPVVLYLDDVVWDTEPIALE